MNPVMFAPDRSKDENEVLKQLIQAFNGCLIQSNQSLNIFDINSGFGCVEAMFFNFQHRLKKKNELMKIMREYKTLYAEALGIKTMEENVDRGSLAFLNKMNEMVKDMFCLIMEELNENEREKNKEF